MPVRRKADFSYQSRYRARQPGVESGSRDRHPAGRENSLSYLAARGRRSVRAGLALPLFDHGFPTRLKMRNLHHVITPLGHAFIDHRARALDEVIVFVGGSLGSSTAK